jgi:hypothetical protein
MSLTELKAQTRTLNSEELFEFGRWVRELEADAWDQQIEADFDAGRLDHLIKEIENDIARGNIKPL